MSVILAFDCVVSVLDFAVSALSCFVFGLDHVVS